MWLLRSVKKWIDTSPWSKLINITILILTIYFTRMDLTNHTTVCDCVHVRDSVLLVILFTKKCPTMFELPLDTLLWIPWPCCQILSQTGTGSMLIFEVHEQVFQKSVLQRYLPRSCSRMVMKICSLVASISLEISRWLGVTNIITWHSEHIVDSDRNEIPLIQIDTASNAG